MCQNKTQETTQNTYPPSSPHKQRTQEPHIRKDEEAGADRGMGRLRPADAPYRTSDSVKSDLLGYSPRGATPITQEVRLGGNRGPLLATQRSESGGDAIGPHRGARGSAATSEAAYGRRVAWIRTAARRRGKSVRRGWHEAKRCAIVQKDSGGIPLPAAGTDIP